MNFTAANSLGHIPNRDGILNGSKIMDSLLCSGYIPYIPSSKPYLNSWTGYSCSTSCPPVSKISTLFEPEVLFTGLVTYRDPFQLSHVQVAFHSQPFS